MISYIVKLMDVQILAQRIRNACVEAALQAYDDAGLQRLCAEGRWEVAIGALKTLDLTSLLCEFQQAAQDC